MIELREEVTIPSPPEEVWPLLRDPELVASCIPGATMSAAEGEGVYRGTIRVRFGPTVATFRGEATLAYDDAARRCTIEGRGIDQRGASRALASGVVTAGGGDSTVLTVEGSFNVTGPLETFANAGGVHVARALLAEFSANMARIVAERRAPSESTAAPAQAPDEPSAALAPSPPPSRAKPSAPAPAAELSGFRLLWRALLSWLAQMFSGQGRRERK